MAALKEHLSDRELALLRTLGTVRVATGEQLQRLHFHDLGGSLASQARQRRRVLTKLTAARLLARLPRTVGGVRAGSSGHVYSLDVAGQRLNETFRAVWRPRSLWSPSQPFLRHRLAITETYVRLVEADRQGGCRLIEFTTEPACWRRFRNLASQAVVLKPDAFVHLETPGFEDYWFLELDRGHESPWTLRRKCDVYHQYWLSGEEGRRHGVFPAVLWSVPDRDRADVLDDVIRRLAGEARQIFQVACFERSVPVLSAKTDARGRVIC